MSLKDIVEFIAKALEVVGVLVIVCGISWSAVAWLRSRPMEHDTSAYSHFRRSLGRSVLLGLEFLVAADIILTVATTPTLRSLSTLGLLILIRSFLSIEIEMELDGHWPWQKSRAATKSASDG